MATVTRGLVNRGDLALWDGRNATVDRIDATGGTITGLAIGSAVDVLQVFGGGTSRTNGTIADAIARIGSSNVTLEFSTGTWTIDSNTTIPANFTCRVPAGCVFSVNTGITLTFSGTVITENPTWYSGLGTVVVSQGGLHGGTFHRTAAERSAGITPANHQVPSHEACGYFMPERYAVNTTPGTTVMQTGVANAIAVAVAAGGGAVLLSDRYKMSGPLAGAAAVDILGTGEGASLEFPAGHGITIGWETGYGSVTYDNFKILGAGGGDYYAIYQAGTLDDADELYGLRIQNLLITTWNVGVKLRTVRNLELVGNWIENVDRGVELVGKCIVVQMTRNKIVKASGGGGTGASACVTLDWFNYTSGAGFVPPEGIQIFDNLLYGFETVLNANTANVVNFRDNDTASTVYGVLFHTVQHVFNIAGNFFDMSGANIVAGVYGQGLGAEATAKIHIENNGFHASTAGASALGVKINDSGNQNQNHVTTEGNYFSGDWKGGDILYNNAGQGAILNNRCQSSTPTNSISVPAVLSGFVRIDGNHCAKNINYDEAELENGEIQLGHNIKSGTTVLAGSGHRATKDTRTGAGAISLTTYSTLLVTTGADALSLADGTEGQEKLITMITDGGDGTLTPTNLYNGTTITFNDVDDTVLLRFTDGEWHVLFNTGCTRA